jgi:outer membrane protein insertion porin family
MRSIAPRDSISGVVTGGNKSLLFNAEFYIHIAGPVRFLLFYDAGQVRDRGESFALGQDVIRTQDPDRGLLYDPFTNILITEGVFIPQREVIGRVSAFKTSAGGELRFFMPVLNVPFRLIAAWNPSRYGIFNNNLELTKAFVFRFAVGTTF